MQEDLADSRREAAAAAEHIRAAADAASNGLMGFYPVKVASNARLLS
jgi:hypothetical protein